MVEQFPEDRKSQLILNLAKARVDLSRSTDRVRDSLDVPAHFRDSVNRRKTAWLLGATLVGMGLARFTRRPKAPATTPELAASPASKHSGRTAVLLSCLSMAGTLLKPAVTAYASDLVKKYGTKER